MHRSRSVTGLGLSDRTATHLIDCKPYCYRVWMICCVILSLCPGSTHLTNWRGWLLVSTNWTTFKTGPPRVTWHLLGRATGWRTFGRGASHVAGESLVGLLLRVYCLLCILFWDCLMFTYISKGDTKQTCVHSLSAREQWVLFKGLSSRLAHFCILVHFGDGHYLNIHSDS